VCRWEQRETERGRDRRYERRAGKIEIMERERDKGREAIQYIDKR